MMSARLRALATACAAILLMIPVGASAHDPSDDPQDQHSHENHSGPPELPPHPGGTSNMDLVANSDKDGTTNSDLAFWEDLAFSGNYNGFRILDISDPTNPVVLSDYFCRGPQNDVSVYKLKNRLLLFQSIDTAQTKASCDGTQAGSSQDMPISTTFPGQRQFGFEGIRVFDVTNPSAPVFLTGVPTACGSHTHTTIPDRDDQRVLIYVSSYPLGSGITPSDSQAPQDLQCQSPHKKISIVQVPAKNPAAASVLRVEPLSSDSKPYPGAQPGNPLAPPFIACHDIQVLMKERIAVGACAGDGQIWDISNPANPTASDGEPHTHIPRPAGSGAPSPQAAADEWEFVHNAIITWDGRYFALADETGGGVTNECDGSAEEEGGQSENGFYYFYPMVEPGQATPPLLSRFMIPRPQGEELCVSHNGNVIPTNDGYFLVAAYYMGGNTVVDFTDPSSPQEIAFDDRSDSIGCADSWSTYWYNDFIYANGGLGRRNNNCPTAPGAASNRGFDVYQLTDADGEVVTARKFHHMNPQTQEVFQGVGDDGRNNNASRQPGDGQG
jgi:LVIVD repeat